MSPDDVEVPGKHLGRPIGGTHGHDRLGGDVFRGSFSLKIVVSLVKIGQKYCHSSLPETPPPCTRPPRLSLCPLALPPRFTLLMPFYSSDMILKCINKLDRD